MMSYWSHRLGEGGGGGGTRSSLNCKVRAMNLTWTKYPLSTPMSGFRCTLRHKQCTIYDIIICIDIRYFGNQAYEMVEGTAELIN